MKTCSSQYHELYRSFNHLWQLMKCLSTMKTNNTYRNLIRRYYPNNRLPRYNVNGQVCIRDYCTKTDPVDKWRFYIYRAIRPIRPRNLYHHRIPTADERTWAYLDTQTPTTGNDWLQAPVTDSPETQLVENSARVIHLLRSYFTLIYLRSKSR